MLPSLLPAVPATNGHRPQVVVALAFEVVNQSLAAGVTGVRSPRGERSLEVLGLESSRTQRSQVALLTPAEATDAGGAQQCPVREDPKTDEVNTSSSGVDANLAGIDCQVELLVEELDQGQAVLTQYRLVGMEDEDVVHVARVLPDLEALLGELVRLV